jgi:group II intron reverse transcriptase/maturase
MTNWKHTMQTSLRGIANRAKRDKKARFGNLSNLLNEQNLRGCFYQLRKDAATGVDGVTFEEYERGLDHNLRDLVERLKRGSYKAKLVRRKHIPKGEGKTRPLGVPTLEDKLLQRACANILGAIYEEDFLECSWGYRPGKGAREASRVLASELHSGGNYRWVVEADIEGFFNHLDHDWMERMLQERVDDRRFLGLIRKWMKAGVLEADGKILHPATGTPQGGIISPILANIYLHYVLDLWFEKGVKKDCRGDAAFIRYADDFVCAFQHKDEAEAFMHQLPQRLGKFGLKVAEDKTRKVHFIRFDGKPPEKFDFLGFEFRWVRRKSGKMGVRRRTSPEKMRKSMVYLAEWFRKVRHWPTRNIVQALNRKLRGYWNYYGVQGNMDSLSKLHWQVRGLLFKWLNRRSQRRSYTWEGFGAMCAHLQLENPRIVEKPLQPTLFP